MNSTHFLFVDDDPEELDILMDVFKDMNTDITIRYAVNGEEALALLDSDHKSGIIPTLIVLDLNMPRMNGSQTLQSLKSTVHFQHIPVIIYSTSLNSYEKERCILMGAHSYLTKPTSYAEAIDTVAYFMKVANIQTIC
jgi:CheY-like chemotaxis protein